MRKIFDVHVELDFVLHILGRFKNVRTTKTQMGHGFFHRNYKCCESTDKIWELLDWFLPINISLNGIDLCDTLLTILEGYFDLMKLSLSSRRRLCNLSTLLMILLWIDYLIKYVVGMGATKGQVWLGVCLFSSKQNGTNWVEGFQGSTIYMLSEIEVSVSGFVTVLV